MYLSVLCIGTGGCEEDIIREGLERGLNFIHTAEGYERGRSIQKIGRVMRTHRDKVYLAVKVDFRDLDAVLFNLNTDYVDFVMFDRHDPRAVNDPSLRERFERWKDQGKARYMGLTSHGHMKGCFQVALDTMLYDVFMPTFNVDAQATMEEELVAAEKKGLPLFPMKSLGGIPADRQGDRVRNALEPSAVVTLVNRMMDQGILNRLIEAQAPERLGAGFPVPPPRTRTAQCTMCSRCGDVCPLGLAVPDMVRCSTYYLDDLKSVDTARNTLREIPRARTALSCTDCGACEAVCPQRFPIRKEIRRTTALVG